MANGGVSVQKTLVEGSPDSVARKVERLRRTPGEGGGYILAPAHRVQAGTKPENLIAMLVAAGRIVI